MTTGKGIIIKQALTICKGYWGDLPSTLKRATIEANALIKHGQYAPTLVPEIYATDEQLAYTVMEDLSHLKLLVKD